MTDPARLKRACEAFQQTLESILGNRLPINPAFLAMESALAAYHHPEEPAVDKWQAFADALKLESHGRGVTADEYKCLHRVIAAVHAVMPEVDRRSIPRDNEASGAEARRIAQLERMLWRIVEFGYVQHMKGSVQQPEVLSLLTTKEQAP